MDVTLSELEQHLWGGGGQVEGHGVVTSADL